MAENIEEPAEPLEQLNNESVDSSTFTVDFILNHRRDENGTVSYLVRWEGFGESHDSWEPTENFMDATPVSDYLWQKIDALDQ